MSSPEPFSIRSDREARGVHRLTPVGELDIATVPILERAFETVFEDGGAEMIVVDLMELGFMDSTGLALLLRMNAVCEDVDRLRVVNGSPAVVRILDISGLRDSLPIISSAEDPLAPLPPMPTTRDG
jgi:anti-sigma B factor antagonist